MIDYIQFITIMRFFALVHQCLAHHHIEQSEYKYIDYTSVLLNM